jgi:hypothetical protein
MGPKAVDPLLSGSPMAAESTLVGFGNSDKLVWSQSISSMI